jgi:chromosome segregation ATPase
MFEDLKSAHSRLQQEYDALKNMARHDFDSELRVAEALNSEQSDHKKTKEASQAQVKALEEEIERLKKALDTEQLDHNKTKSASQDSINSLGVNLKELEDQVYLFFFHLKSFEVAKIELLARILLTYEHRFCKLKMGHSKEDKG